MSEILGTLFGKIAALITVAAVTLVLYQFFGASKAAQAINDLTQLHSNIQTTYNAQQSFSSLTNTVAITGKLAPPKMINGTSLVNPWGGAVTVRVNGSDTAKFDVAQTNIPNDACAKLATNIPMMVGLTVNGAAQTLPADQGSVIASCGSGNNAMTFTFSGV